jgi:hypothetical protein
MSPVVQYHDILSRMCGDILYTSGARMVERGEWKRRWAGRRWTFENNGCDLWWRRYGGSGHSAVCAESLRFRARPGAFGWSGIAPAEWRRSPSGAGGRCTVRGRPRRSWNSGWSSCASAIPTGARKLRVRLGAAGIELPASTIHRILLRHQLVEEQDRHRPAPQRFERATPNELWQMDFKGPKSWHQPVGPLSVLDDHSRYVIALEALGGTHAGLVRARLEEAFVECGVPQSMLMDHGVPWWSWAGPKAATTGLALWLIKQGIRLCWSGIGHPPDARQGGALSRRARTCAGQAWAEWSVATALAGRVSLGA